MLLLIITNLLTLGLYIVLHKRYELLTKELIKTQHEIGYKLWIMEGKIGGLDSE